MLRSIVRSKKGEGSYRFLGQWKRAVDYGSTPLVDILRNTRFNLVNWFIGWRSPSFTSIHPHGPLHPRNKRVNLEAISRVTQAMT